MVLYHLYIKVHDEALLPYYTKAVQKVKDAAAHKSFTDSGFDLYLLGQELNTTSNEVSVIDHHISCAMYRYEHGQRKPCGFYMYPRSSLSKTPYRLANSVGIIDSGYRGKLLAKVDRLYDVPYVIEDGDRLFQICTPDLSPISRIDIVDEFSEQTERGENGFGSTGKGFKDEDGWNG